ncbi:hypothetical protein PR202_gb08359 [Eleusine coracana subsp. coracana]|uniref:Cathepsin propeptide inhibitor domain-containing protein n=1 Tax=Eleusine coracana subsp. coracana TaxID=191504 RepID=A0AAV5EEE2_ELECO|nr:hypothetical protein PR202_gb08359 [Eleusine coracana subsp. coracana]
MCHSTATSRVHLIMRGFEQVPAHDEFQLLLAVTYGPVAVSLAVGKDSVYFADYYGGLYPGPCGTVNDHEMLLVGYGYDYYILQNSFGENWGEKAHYFKTNEYAGEEECRYALFKDSRRRVARANAAGVTSSGLNGISAHANEEIFLGHGVQMGEESYEEETRRMFAGWKAKYGKIYRDVGEEECRYRLFKGNRRLVVKLNAVAAGEAVYGLNQFGDLTDEEVRECCDGRGSEGKLRTRCQAAVLSYIVVEERPILSQVCWCIAIELKQTEFGEPVVAASINFGKEDLESKESLWSLYERWGARYNRARDPADKVHHLDFFKATWDEIGALVDVVWDRKGHNVTPYHQRRISDVAQFINVHYETTVPIEFLCR